MFSAAEGTQHFAGMGFINRLAQDHPPALGHRVAGHEHSRIAWCDGQTEDYVFRLLSRQTRHQLSGPLAGA